VSEPVVLTEVTDRVALITLNRPDARNALSSEVLAALP
jgi:enoyl-CoA hydratase